MKRIIILLSFVFVAVIAFPQKNYTELNSYNNTNINTNNANQITGAKLNTMTSYLIQSYSFDLFDATRPYYGDSSLVLYTGYLWHCSTSHLGAWNASNFDQMTGFVDQGSGTGSVVGLIGGSTATGLYGTSFGLTNTNAGDNAFIGGTLCDISAAGDGSTAFGTNFDVTGFNSGGMGNLCTVSGLITYVFGNAMTGSGDYCFGGGRSIVLSGDYCFGSGYQNSASATGANVFGVQDTAAGPYTFVTGYQNKASASYSSVLSGTGNTISAPATNSAILGISGITLSDANTLYTGKIIVTDTITIYESFDGDYAKFYYKKSGNIILNVPEDDFEIQTNVVSDSSFQYQIGVSDHMYGGTVIGYNELNPAVNNTAFYVALKFPVELFGSLFFVDSVIINVKTNADAAYITGVNVAHCEGTTCATDETYTTDIGNGDQLAYSVNVVATPFAAVTEKIYHLYLLPAGMIATTDVDLYNGTVYGHLE